MMHTIFLSVKSVVRVYLISKKATKISLTFGDINGKKKKKGSFSLLSSVIFVAIVNVAVFFFSPILMFIF